MSEQESKPGFISLIGTGRDHFNTLRIPTGSMVIVTDIPIYETKSEGKDDVARNDKFILYSSDGKYKSEISVQDVEYTDDESWVSLVFNELPTNKSYSLKSILQGEDEIVHFEDVPYAEITKNGVDLEGDAGLPSEQGEY